MNNETIRCIIASLFHHLVMIRTIKVLVSFSNGHTIKLPTRRGKCMFRVLKRNANFANSTGSLDNLGPSHFLLLNERLWLY